MTNDGIIIINKQQNMTSHDVVAQVRRIFGIRRIGHTGTLDPMATGVLPVCVGRATRIMEYLDLDLKEYRCSMKLGRRMDTQDVWGQETARVSPERVNLIRREDVEAAFAAFHGVISQTPPMYSAVRVNGKKLYEYARAGETAEVKARKIYIDRLAIEAMDLGRGYESTVTFSVRCSKGTYIRAICEEAGERLGVYGAMSALIREASGAFRIEDAVELAELAVMDKKHRERLLLNIPDPLVHFGELEVQEYDARRLLNGLPVWIDHCTFGSEPEYRNKEFPLPIRPEFRRAYRAFGPVEGKKTFLGVVFADEAYENVKADKIFYTRG